MNIDSPPGLGFMEERAYTIGREGHIRLDDASVSRGHAEIKFINGNIRLRDLGSTNGTYLVTGDNIINVDESLVFPDQRVVIGNANYTVKELLALVGIYASYSDKTGLIVKLSSPAKRPAKKTTDLDELVSQSISELYEESTLTGDRSKTGSM